VDGESWESMIYTIAAQPGLLQVGYNPLDPQQKHERTFLFHRLLQPTDAAVSL